MNTKMVSIKKRFINVFNKILNQPKSESSTMNQNMSTPIKKLRLKSVTKGRSDISSSLSTISSIRSDKQSTETCSSGLGTSAQSSGLVNLDNYFCDENFSSIKTRAQENAQRQRSNIARDIFNNQVQFLQQMKQDLERIRPLSVLMDTQLFFDIFQNIEKIHAVSLFIHNAINDSIFLTQDQLTSILSVTTEYIKLLLGTYETYLMGYVKAEQCLNNPEFAMVFEELSGLEFLQGFDLLEFIDLPIKNITRMFCLFMSLRDFTHPTDTCNNERIETVCVQLKALIGPNESSLISDDLNGSLSSEEVCRSVLPEDFVDEDGKKIYFV